MRIAVSSKARKEIFATLIILLLVCAHAFAQTETDAAPVAAVELVEMTVTDLDRSAKFFCEVLEFEIASESTANGIRQIDLSLGDERLRLSQHTQSTGRPIPSDSRGNDQWFQHVAIIVSDMDRAYQKLRRFKVRHASSGPQTLPDWNIQAAGIKAFYFRDPDGHFLEILEFPNGKGDPKWHRKTDKLFLGIDHTAIVVKDTDASLRFYRDTLGLRVAGTSENFGTEQEHLNGVFGARLRITALRADSGPGIELLEYLSPSDGRDAPHDVNSKDVMYWCIHLKARQPQRLVSQIRDKHQPLSDGVESSDQQQSNDVPRFVVCDPDWHALQISN